MEIVGLIIFIIGALLFVSTKAIYLDNFREMNDNKILILLKKYTLQVKIIATILISVGALMIMILK